MNLCAGSIAASSKSYSSLSPSGMVSSNYGYSISFGRFWPKVAINGKGLAYDE